MLEEYYHPFVRAGNISNIRRMAVRGKVLHEKLPIPLMAAGFLGRGALAG
jgi:hypothetical protein